MFKGEVKSADATALAPFHTYDSVLEIPDGQNPEQNAWLTIKLKVQLNFIDSAHPNGKLVQHNGVWCAQDHDGWLFPAMDWPAHLQTRFSDEFQEHAEKTWNWQYLLVNPPDYSEIDYADKTKAGWMVHPNLLCLFRMEFVTTGAHRIINIYNLAMGSASKFKASGETGPITNINEDFRSDSGNYADRDVLKPAILTAQRDVIVDTVGHEVGHALGQSHIMGLKGVAKCLNGSPNSGDNDCYGRSSPDKFDAENVMGSGHRLYLINAISWTKRIKLHTGTDPDKWSVTGIMTTPTKKIPAKNGK